MLEKGDQTNKENAFMLAARAYAFIRKELFLCGSSHFGAICTPFRALTQPF